MLKDICMTEPAGKGHIILDPERPYKLLKIVSLRAIADNSKVGQIGSQNFGSCTQANVAGLSAN
jgi:hypothetical protein